ncbi:hypothetical protein DL767_006728 [Monosporascus sp. MG133]|nr:hypothetical protein DL767_006728 [Monosporascus sp. MG133]
MTPTYNGDDPPVFPAIAKNPTISTFVGLINNLAFLFLSTFLCSSLFSRKALNLHIQSPIAEVRPLSLAQSLQYALTAWPLEGSLNLDKLAESIILLNILSAKAGDLVEERPELGFSKETVAGVVDEFRQDEEKAALGGRLAAADNPDRVWMLGEAFDFTNR